MTRLLHVGDFHAGPGPRNADRFRALDQIIREGLALERLGAWLWPGDLNDARMTIEDRNALATRLQQMAARAPVVIVYGNHDQPGDLDVFEKLRAGFPIYVLAQPQCVRIRLATGENATVFALPYPQKAGLVGGHIAPDSVTDAAADLLEPIFLVAAAELKAARAEGDLTLMIGHVNVAGARLSNGQPNVGHEIELNPKHLDRLGDIPKLLNHVHKPQGIAGAHYAGSVCRLDYGESEEKRYLVLDVDDPALLNSLRGEGWTFEGHTYELSSHPIDVAPMFHVVGLLTREGFALAESSDAEVERRYHAGDWTGCDVRCRFSYKASEKSVLSEATVRDLFAGALRLKVEGIAVPDRELRAPEVAAAKTLPAKLAAYRKVDQLEPSIALKVSALEHLEPETLLASVRNLIASIEEPEKARVAA